VKARDTASARKIKGMVMAALDEAEGIGGPQGGEYIALMREIAEEATERAETCENALPGHRCYIELVLKGDASDCQQVVDAVLDAGHLQTAICEHELDAGPVEVRSCLLIDTKRVLPVRPA
jgi:hypothetical protein